MMPNYLDGGRPLPVEDRDFWGRHVRDVWIRWAKAQPNPKPSWLVEFDQLSEADKEADRQIGEQIARLTLLLDAAKMSAMESDHWQGECVECGNPTRFAIDKFCEQCEYHCEVTP